MHQKESEEKPILVIKPSLINALFLNFLKNFFESSIVGALIFFLFYVLNYFKIYTTSISILSAIIFVAIIFFSITPLTWRIIILHNTTYYFYEDRIKSEFKFFKIDEKTIPYTKINELTSDISFWDRLCKAGDITVHTEGDDNPNLFLAYINDPKKIENFIHLKMNKTKK